MGHLGCADNPPDPCNKAGRACFGRGAETARAACLRSAVRHLAATVGDNHRLALRPHLVPDRLAWLASTPPCTTRLRPALTLTAPIVAVRRVRAGSPVGYRAFLDRAADTTRPAAGGDAVGLPRAASGRAKSWRAGAGARSPG